MRILVLVGTFALNGLAESVKRTFIGLSSQNIDADIDVVIIDVVCSQSFRDNVSRLKLTHNRVSFYLLHINEKINFYTMWSIGLKSFLSKSGKKLSQYDYVIYSHEDVEVPDPDGLTKMISDFENKEIGIVLGWCRYRNAKNRIAKYNHLTGTVDILPEPLVSWSTAEQNQGRPWILKPGDSAFYNFVIWSMDVFKEFEGYTDVFEHSWADHFLPWFAAACEKKAAYCTKITLPHNAAKAVRPAKILEHCAAKHKSKYGFVGTGMTNGMVFRDLLVKGAHCGYFFTGEDTVFLKEFGEHTSKPIDPPALKKFIKDNLFHPAGYFDHLSSKCVLYSLNYPAAHKRGGGDCP